MTNLEKIRQKIIEAVPEIVALKFGCEIECRFGRGIVSGESDIHGMLAYIKGDGTYHSGEIGGNVRIIGRQITLEDVLQAVGERLREGKFDKVIGVTDVGTFWVGYNDKGMRRMDLMMDNEGGFINWLLGKPLTDQSPEFINFLYNIFYGKG